MSRPLECSEQAFTLVHEPLEFAARLLGSFGEVSQDAFTVGTYFGDHLTTLLFGELEFLLGFARDV